MALRTTLTLTLAAGTLLLAPIANAAQLDFEGGIGYTPSDDLAITTTTFNAYNISIVGALSFESVGGGQAQSGTPSLTEGFVTDKTGRQYDEDIDPDNNLDSFFLRQTQAFPASTGSLTNVFTINWLKNPTSTVSGQIWDIDAFRTNTEQWDVVASYAGGGTLTESSPIGLTPDAPGNLDGQAWVFSFAPSDSGGALKSLTFNFTGNKPNIGVAFDNFETGVSTIPEVSATGSVAALGSVLGLVFLLVERRGGLSIRRRVVAA